MKALIISNITKKFQAGHFSMITPLKELGYEVHWAANFSNYTSDVENTPLKIHHIDFHRNPLNFKNFTAFFQLMKLMKNEQYDLIHCNSPIGGLLGRIVGKLLNVNKIFYTAHGFHFYKGAPFVNHLIFKRIEIFLSKFTDVIFTINKEDYNAVLNTDFKFENNVYHIPGVGVDTKEYSTVKPTRKKLIGEIGAEQDAILLVSVGELNINKNNKNIIKSLGLLKNPRIHYILCGVGKEKNNLYMLAKELSIENNIHFLGYRSDVAEILISCDVFILPSYREGLSRSLMEAMSVGLPCVVSDIRGNIDLINDGKGGYLVSPNNIKGFSNVIDHLANNESIRREMGRYNVSRIQRYDIENVKIEMMNIYKKELFNN